MPVVVTGPFFEGNRTAIMNEICAEIEKDLAAVGYAQVKTNLVTFIRKPTPYYWTKTEVRGNPSGPGLSIWDSYIIYGPWLEGVGSRNFPKTRFRGYSSFRLAARALEVKAAMIAERAIGRKIGKLN